MATTLRTSRRLPVWVAAVVLALLASLLPQVTSPAHADSGMEAEFVALINKERAATGAKAVKVAGDLTSVARTHSKRMADQDHLHHNPNLGSDVTGWRKVGENVGRGPSVGAIHNAFMNSSGHKRNILDPDWIEVGVGVVIRDGQVWVTEIFRVPSGSTSEPKPEPEPEPEPKKESTSSSSGTESSSGSSSKPASAPAPEPAPEPEPEPEPEPHEVVDKPLPLDRMTLMLARQEAQERSLSLEEVLASDD
jgi:hypothetical protein